ncbi:LysR family transcriptional regulator ArgP [Aureimonas pseudogalii]|uniref:LysR family transcriptional regulator (Chromosome initiation inhibitor) n=1 Tax=Aureimonas pseudogalii TaxID=1744844 RepID=A0A7W6H752_9HYPH|nr:LysR family transcriptional regulator ArgP [Aureimonas pseudogalii]MBB3999814.1 LysR family transcriptional regulator (chromosome initiation inhibitor) [Aureimonas pseudogalii]
MWDYALLRALAEVIAEGSFERAARRLGLTPSAVSQRVKLLEERTGTALVVRGQPCRATEAGRRLCRHAGEVALLEGGLRADLGALVPQGPRPTIRIAVNADSLATWFLPALAGIEDRLFDLVVDDEEHTTERLRRGEVMAAVATTPGPVAGCSSRPLGSLVYEASASPAFAARWFADGVTPQALGQAPSLLFDAKDRLQDRWIESLFGEAPPRPVHRVPSSQGFVDAALAGLGWGLNPRALAGPHVAAGRLMALAGGHSLAVPLFWHWSRAVGPALKPLTDAVTREARRGLAR